MSDIENSFPNIAQEGYTICSPKSIEYNCIAWAADDNSKWWWPDIDLLYYWPENLPREATLETFVAMFSEKGYKICDNAELETEYEKVAIYTNETGVTHATKQLESGKWTSKLGPNHDIEHTLIGLFGKEYGRVAQILKRKKLKIS